MQLNKNSCNSLTTKHLRKPPTGAALSRWLSTTYETFMDIKNPLPATQGRGMTANNKPKPRLIHPQPLPCQEHSQHDR